MAVVMLIMGTLLSGLLVALTQTSNNTRITTAKTQILKIEEALYAFAQAHGRLPCPATFDSNGYESPVGGGDCNLEHGFVPAASLSLYGRINDDGLMLDPWSNPYRYSIAPYEVDASGNWEAEDDGEYAFTDKILLQELFNNPNMNSELRFNSGDYSSTLRICTSYQCSPGESISTLAPAVVLSMGPNWTELNSDCPAGTVNSDEEANAGTNWHNSEYCLTDTNTFANAEYNEENFDDIIIWLSPYILFSRLIDASQLP